MAVKARNGRESQGGRRRRRAGLAIGTVLLAAVSTCATAGAAQADTYQRTATTTLSGRTITLWLNETNDQWHAEISAAAGGDKIHLDYTNNPLAIDGGYLVDSSTVASGATYANTGDHTYTYARACGFVGSSSKCTGWWQP